MDYLEEKLDNKESREKEEILSIPVRAGKRTYFFDVKTTRANEFYLTITESKKRFNSEDGKFSFEKHKVFLYKEDFEKFSSALSDSIAFIETGKKPDMERYAPVNKENTYQNNVNFDDLGDDKV